MHRRSPRPPDWTEEREAIAQDRLHDPLGQPEVRDFFDAIETWPVFSKNALYYWEYIVNYYKRLYAAINNARFGTIEWQTWGHVASLLSEWASFRAGGKPPPPGPGQARDRKATVLLDWLIAVLCRDIDMRPRPPDRYTDNEEEWDFERVFPLEDEPEDISLLGWESPSTFPAWINDELCELRRRYRDRSFVSPEGVPWVQLFPWGPNARTDAVAVANLKREAKRRRDKLESLLRSSGWMVTRESGPYGSVVLLPRACDARVHLGLWTTLFPKAVEHPLFVHYAKLDIGVPPSTKQGSAEGFFSLDPNPIHRALKY